MIAGKRINTVPVLGVSRNKTLLVDSGQDSVVLAQAFESSRFPLRLQRQVQRDQQRFHNNLIISKLIRRKYLYKYIQMRHWEKKNIYIYNNNNNNNNNNNYNYNSTTNNK